MKLENGHLPIILCKEEPMFISPEGEGIWTGKLVSWSRLSGCNLSCSWEDDSGVTICDSAFTSWHPTRKKMTMQEVFDFHFNAIANGCSFTGGEPTIQDNIFKVIDALEENGKRCKYETNGTRFVQSKASLVSISPKLQSSHSGFKTLIKQEENEEKKARLIERESNQSQTRYQKEELQKILDFYGEKAQFKFVINNDNDILEVIQDFYEELKIPCNQICLMPQGISHEQLNQKSQWVIEQCKKYRFNYSDRIHIRVYGSKIGV